MPGFSHPRVLHLEHASSLYRLLLICLLLGSLFVALLPAFAVPVAAQDAGISVSASAAFSGAYRPGAWLPVHVDLRNQGVDRRVEVRAGHSDGPQYAVQLDLPGGAQKQATIYVYMPTSLATLKVYVLDGTAELAAADVRVTATRGRERLIGVLSASGSAPVLPPRLPDSVPLTVVPLMVADLPDDALGLSSFSGLLLDDLPTADLRPTQVAALEGWVLRGGRLLIGGGAGAERTLVGLPETLRPATVGAERLLPAAELFGAAAVNQPDLPISSLTPNTDAQDRLALETPVFGMGAAGEPVLLVQELGAGSVGQFALPFGHPALRTVADPAAFWADLLHATPALPNGFAPDGMNSDGFLESNLASALTSLPALEFPSLTMLGLLLIAYVLVVGPGIYLLLRRLDRQMFGWIAVPVATLLFAGLAYGIGYAQRGGDVLLNQVTLIESLPGSADQARIRTFTGLFSPNRSEYTLEGSTSLLRPISLQGPWTPTAMQNSGVFVQDSPSGPHVDGIAVEQWSMSAVAADTIGSDVGLFAQVRIDGETVTAEVENRSDQPISDVSVVQGELVGRVGDLDPGARVEMALSRPRHVGGPASGMPLSYLVYGEEMDDFGRRGMPQPAEMQLRVRLLDALFSYGPTPRDGQPLAIGWRKQSPSELRPPDLKAEVQQQALIVARPQIMLNTTDVTLESGWMATRFEGSQVNLCYGNQGAGVSLAPDPIVAEMRLPRDLAGLQPTSLTLLTSSDGAWIAGTQVEVYDWRDHGWAVQPAEGKPLELAEPERYLSGDGRMRVRLSGENNMQMGFGCIYVDAKLKGTLQ